MTPCQPVALIEEQGGDITLVWLMTAHWDLGGGGEKRQVGNLGHKSNHLFWPCWDLIWAFLLMLIYFVSHIVHLSLSEKPVIDFYFDSTFIHLSFH